jgi:pyruvate kinase
VAGRGTRYKIRSGQYAGRLAIEVGRHGPTVIVSVPEPWPGRNIQIDQSLLRATFEAGDRVTLDDGRTGFIVEVIGWNAAVQITSTATTESTTVFAPLERLVMS